MLDIFYLYFIGAHLTDGDSAGTEDMIELIITIVHCHKECTNDLMELASFILM